jgi:hypothetical protein
MKTTLIILGLMLFFGGCSQKIAPDPALINQYNSQTPPVQSNQVRINIVRANSILGANRDVYILCNKKAYTLSNGRYISCLSNNEMTNIYFYQKDINVYLLSIALDDGNLLYEQAGNTVAVNKKFGTDVFLYVAPMEDVVEIDSNYAKTLIMDAKNRFKQ